MSTVLVVDDEPQLLRLVEETLRAVGHQVVAVTRSEEALEMTESHQFDLVVLDVMMPGMSGIELLARLRENTATRDLPVLLLSALSEGSDRVKGLQAGAADYLCKPFLPDELVLRVNRAVATSPRHAAVLQGRFEFIPLAAVLQNLLLGMVAGTLEVLADQTRGEIVIVDNQVISARLGDLEGRDAVLAMLDLDRGGFSFRPGNVKQDATTANTTEISIQDLIFTAAWLMDEIARRPAVDAGDLLWPVTKGGPPPELPEGFERLPGTAVWTEIQRKPGLAVSELESQVASASGMVRLAVALLVEMEAVNTTSPVITRMPNLKSSQPGFELEEAIHRIAATARKRGCEESMIHLLLAVEPGVHEHLLRYRMEIPSHVLAAPGGSLAAAWHSGRPATLALRSGQDTVVLHIASIDREAAAAHVVRRIGDYAAAAIWTADARLVSPIRAIADGLTSGDEGAWGLLIAQESDAGPRAAACLRERARWQVHLGVPADFADILTLMADAGQLHDEDAEPAAAPAPSGAPDTARAIAGA